MNTLLLVISQFTDLIFGPVWLTVLGFVGFIAMCIFSVIVIQGVEKSASSLLMMILIPALFLFTISYAVMCLLMLVGALMLGISIGSLLIFGAGIEVGMTVVTALVVTKHIIDP